MAPKRNATCRTRPSSSIKSNVANATNVDKCHSRAYNRCTVGKRKERYGLDRGCDHTNKLCLGLWAGNVGHHRTRLSGQGWPRHPPGGSFRRAGGLAQKGPPHHTEFADFYLKLIPGLIFRSHSFLHLHCAFYGQWLWLFFFAT